MCRQIIILLIKKNGYNLCKYITKKINSPLIRSPLVLPLQVLRAWSLVELDDWMNTGILQKVSMQRMILLTCEYFFWWRAAQVWYACCSSMILCDLSLMSLDLSERACAELCLIHFLFPYLFYWSSPFISSMKGLFAIFEN